MLRGIQTKNNIAFSLNYVCLIQMHVFNVGKEFSQEELGVEDSTKLLQKEGKARAGECRACQCSRIKKDP